MSIPHTVTNCLLPLNQKVYKQVCDKQSLNTTCISKTKLASVLFFLSCRNHCCCCQSFL